MKYYICVAGCRNYAETEEHYSFVASYLDYVLQNLKNQGEIVIIHGACRGVDLLGGRRYARERKYKCLEFPADWNTYGNYAGPKRNAEMVSKSTHIVVFWDGKSKGTYNLIQNAKKAGKPLKIKIIDI